MLNKSGKSEHPCLFPDLGEKAFSFSLLRMILVIGCHIRSLLWSLLRYVPSIFTLLSFYHNGCWLATYSEMHQKDKICG